MHKGRRKSTVSCVVRRRKEEASKTKMRYEKEGEKYEGAGGRDRGGRGRKT